MAITFPTAWVSGEKVKPSKLNAFFSAISGKFLAGIVAADLSATAGVRGSQLSTASGSRITFDNLEDGQVYGSKIKSDGATGRPNAAITTSMIAGGAVDAVALAQPCVARANLNAAVFSVSLTTLFGASSIQGNRQLGPVLLTNSGPGNIGFVLDSTKTWPLYTWIDRADPAVIGPLILFYNTSPAGNGGYLSIANTGAATVTWSTATANFLYLL